MMVVKKSKKDKYAGAECSGKNIFSVSNKTSVFHIYQNFSPLTHQYLLSLSCMANFQYPDLVPTNLTFSAVNLLKECSISYGLN